MYEAIVVGTDGSDTAKRAVAEASRLAEATGGRLHIVAAYEPLRGAKIVGAPEGAQKVWEVKPDAAVQGVIEEAVLALSAFLSCRCATSSRRCSGTTPGGCPSRSRR